MRSLRLGPLLFSFFDCSQFFTNQNFPDSRRSKDNYKHHAASSFELRDFSMAYRAADHLLLRRGIKVWILMLSSYDRAD
jgi:hypothetical protein